MSREAVRSQTVLCLVVGNPPKGHTIAWSTEKEVPHWQVLDVLDGEMPSELGITRYKNNVLHNNITLVVTK